MTSPMSPVPLTRRSRSCPGPGRARPDTPADAVKVMERVAASLRYHDLGPLVGEPGIAMTGVDADGLPTVTLVLDRAIPMRMSFTAAYDPGADLAAEMGRVIDLAFVSYGGADRSEGLRFMFPGPFDGPVSRDWAGAPADLFLAAHAGHRAQARAALRAPSLPAGMRHALHSVLDHGLKDVTDAIPSTRAWMARKDGTGIHPPLWDLVGLLARVPSLYLLAQDTEGVYLHVAEGVPVPEAFRREFPRLTDRHLDALCAAEIGGGPVFDAVAGRNGHRHAAMLRALCAVPPEWVPGTVHQWRAFGRIAQATDGFAEATGSGLGTLLAPVRGNWSAFLSRCHRAVEDGDHRHEGATGAIELYSSDMEDVAASLARTVVLPAMAHASRMHGGPFTPHGGGRIGSRAVVADAAARRILYAGKGIPAALELSARWHARSAAIEATVRGGMGDVRWPALFDAPIRIGNRQVVVISDSRSLLEEGSRGPDRNGVPGLSHCVATRMARYASGRSHVLSVRRLLPGGGYERLSTAQVRLLSDPPRIEVDEHRGRSNGAVPDEASWAMHEVVRQVRQGKVTVTATEPLPVKPTRERDLIAEECGYDWRDQAAVANAIAAWSDVLPRWTRGLGSDAFLAACISKGILDEGWQAGVGWK